MSCIQTTISDIYLHTSMELWVERKLWSWDISKVLYDKNVTLVIKPSLARSVFVEEKIGLFLWFSLLHQEKSQKFHIRDRKRKLACGFTFGSSRQKSEGSLSWSFFQTPFSLEKKIGLFLWFSLLHQNKSQKVHFRDLFFFQTTISLKRKLACRFTFGLSR